MNKERLKAILFDQKDAFNQKQQLIERDIELDKFIQTGQVIIIAGIRRCGKSSLMNLIKNRMNLKEEEYCYFNFDDERIIAEISILDDLFNLHLELYGKEPILFLDEIQNIQNWEKFVNRVYEKGVKVFVTGSNAKLLSSDISTSLTGRNKIIELFPFSFPEFLRFIGSSYTPDRLTSKQRVFIQKDFNKYLEIGGFPLVVKENDLELINNYFQDILYRDIISRYRLSQVKEIKEIALYFASNIGKIYSFSTIQSITGIKSLSSISNYLAYYEQSYLFFYLKKFDFSVKKQIMNPKKVYVIDSAFAHRMGFNFSENKGRIMENIVYLELLRRKKEVYYYSGKNECDFLIKEGMRVVEAIQVTHSVNALNAKREFDGLKEVMQNYNLKEGILITNSIEGNSIPSETGIKIIEPWRWLLKW